MNVFIELVYNLSILVSIGILSGFIQYKQYFGRHQGVVMGLLMGGAAVLGMMHPFVVMPGLIFDERSVILSVAGAFFGPVAAIVAGIIALAYRLGQGGPGAMMGAIVIVSSSAVGSLLFLRNRKKELTVDPKMLYKMGLAVHVLMIAAMFALPQDMIISTIVKIGLPVMVVYPAATVLFGMFLTKIDEHRKVLDALRESQNQLMLAIDNAPIPIMLRADDGEVLKVSRKWTEITGYAIEDIPTIDAWTKKAYGNEYEAMQRIIRETYKDDKALPFTDFKVRTADGSHKIWHFNIANIGKTTDGRNMAMTAAMDITDQKVAEEALRSSEEKYRFLTEYASDVIWVLNLSQGKYTYISPSILNLRGLTAEEALQESMEDSLTPESLELVRKSIEENLKIFVQNPELPQQQINEVQQPCKNGKIIWVEVSTKYRYNEAGEIEVLGVSRNVEERKKAEQGVLYLSYHDQLTGLYNRRFYEAELERLDCARSLPLTVVMADVNGLKLVNDSFGHSVGTSCSGKSQRCFKRAAGRRISLRGWAGMNL